MTQDTCVTHECNGRYVWDNNKIGDFLVKLQSEDVKQQLYVLNNNIQQATTNDEIDSTVDSFTTLIESVLSSFYKQTKITPKENEKSGNTNFIFNEECEYKKLAFLDMLNKYRKDSIDTNRINMVKARTDFKMTVRKFKSELEKAKTKRLIDAKYKNAKEYWKLLKDAANTHTLTPKCLPTNTFAEYFKSINNPGSVFFKPDEDILYFQQRFLDSEIQVMFSELDVEITREEIIKSIRQLKNGKSGGPDKLLNEFFYSWATCFVTMLTFIV